MTIEQFDHLSELLADEAWLLSRLNRFRVL